jgi:hypothetical protein
MTRRSITLFALLLGLAGGAPLVACDFFLGDTKTGKGVLYTSGDQRYDPYFEQVHKEQLAAAQWPDEAKASRKPIVDALSLKPDASNSTILSSTKAAKSTNTSLGGPVEQTTNAEVDRARKMNAEQKRLADIRDHGAELKKQAAEDRENMGAQKADDKAVAHKDEVKRELGAAVDALNHMIHDAEHNQHEAEELAGKLTAAMTGKPEDEKKIDVSAPPADHPAASASVSASASAAPPPPKKKPKAAPAGNPSPAPAPAPKPAPKPPDEVFNP